MKFVLAAAVLTFSFSAFAGVNAKNCKLTVTINDKTGTTVEKVAKAKITKHERGEIVTFSEIKGIGGQVLLLSDSPGDMVRGVITTDRSEQGFVADLDQNNPQMSVRQMRSDMSVVDVNLNCLAK